MDWARVIAQKGVPRFARFWHFTMTARGTADLGVKIANYCTALESMFTTDSSELVHKIAERVACFLGDNRATRKKIFHEIKEAYSLRSKVVHGDVIGAAKLKGIREVSKQLDECLRQICNRFLGDGNIQRVFAQDVAAVTDFFEDLVFE